MKKIIITLAVLLLAVPAMATVTITVVAGPGPNDVTVGFTSDEGQLVRAIALDVQVDDPNVVIVDVNCVSDGYEIHPGSIGIDGGGNVTDWGTCAGAGLDSNTMASEQGSLYIGAANEPSPGDLFIITLGNCTLVEDGNVVVSVSLNALRGGIVMEDAGPPSADDTSATATVNVGACVIGCPTCLGDLTDDGWVTTADLGALFNMLGMAGLPYQIPTTSDDCGDLTQDLWITTADLGALFNMLGMAGLPYQIPCP